VIDDVVSNSYRALRFVDDPEYGELLYAEVHISTIISLNLPTYLPTYRSTYLPIARPSRAIRRVVLVG
jgi:hypothetical protein